jgi:hypothetical protein
LNGIGVPCGEMKGVLHSDADPNVAALEMSELDELNRMPMPIPPGPLLGPPPGNRWSGKALPELCRDLIIGTGVLRGEMKGLAEGLCGSEPCRGEMG